MLFVKLPEILLLYSSIGRNIQYTYVIFIIQKKLIEKIISVGTLIILPVK